MICLFEIIAKKIKNVFPKTVLVNYRRWNFAQLIIKYNNIKMNSQNYSIFSLQEALP